MGLIAIDRVWSPSFCFGAQGFQSNDFLAFSFQYQDESNNMTGSIRVNI